MRILVFTDVHGNMNLLKKHKEASKEVDLVLMSGDLSFMGRDLKGLLEFLNTFSAPVLIIHGNHDEEEEMRVVCSTLENITFLHERIIEFDGWFFGGFGTSGLGSVYEDFEEWIANNKDELFAAKPLVWMDHPPPYGTLLDELDEEWHVGSLTLRDFIEQFSPHHVFCGHIHETFGLEDRLGETIIINSGPAGRVVELKK